MTTKLAATLLIGALAFSPGFAKAAEDTHSLEQLVVEMASTPAQHAALSDYYRSKAEEARAEMRRHERMGRSYGGGKLTKRKKMQEHCSKLSGQFDSIAKEYDDLAKMHQTESETAK